MTNPDSDSTAEIRVVLPHHLRTLAGVQSEIRVTVQGAVSQRTVLDAVEHAYPMLRGTIRQHDTNARRPKVRFFADRRDVTHQPPDDPLPEAITAGAEPFMIVGAISGG